MSNTVQANIEVNATMNTSSVDKGTEKLINDFNTIDKAIKDAFNDPSKVTLDSIDKMHNGLQTVVTDLQSLMGNIPESQFENAKNLVLDLGQRFLEFGEQYKNTFNSNSVVEQFSTELSAVDSEVKAVTDALNSLSNEVSSNLNNTFGTSINDVEALKNKLLEIADNTSDETYVKLADSFNNVNSQIETLRANLQSLSEAQHATVDEFGNTIQLNIPDELLDNTKELTKSTSELNEKTSELNNTRYVSFESGMKALESFFAEKKALDDLSDAMNKYNEEQAKAISELTVDGGVDLAAKDLDYLADKFNDVTDAADNGEDKVEDYSAIVKMLASHLGVSNNEAASFAKALGASAGEAAAAGVAIGVIVGVLKLYIDRLHEAEDALVKLGEGAVDASINGIEFFVDAIGTLVETLDEALEKMEEFAEKGAEIQTAYYNTFTVLGEEAGNEVLSFADKLEHLYGLDGDELVEDMQSLVAAAGSLGVSTGDMVKASENMTIMANDLSILAGSFEKASNDIGNAISKGFVGRNSVLYVLMTKQEKDELKSLGSEVERYNYLMALSTRIKGRYVEFLNTEAGQLMLLKAQYGQLINNISKLALGLYAKIAPVLTKLIQLANIALTFIMKVFNIDLKSSANTGFDTGSIADGIANTMKKAGDSSKKAEKDISKSTKKAAKAVKELEKQVASFDDVIQIKDNKANDDTLDIGDIDANLDDIGNLDDGLNDLIGDFDLLGDAVNNANDEFEEFRKLLNEGKYTEAGKWLASWLADQLEKIPWDEIQDKAKKAGTAIAEFLNGFNSDKRLWKDIGHTIAEALNTAVDFLLEFARNFDWAEFGNSLGVAWKQFWKDFDEVEAGQALYEWFMGVIKMAGSFFATNPLTSMAESLVQMIHSFFDSFNADENAKTNIAETVKNILTDIFKAAFVLAKGLVRDLPSILDFINTVLDSMIEWLDDPNNTYIQDIGKAIISILQKVKESGIIDKVKDIIIKVMDEINLSEILSLATDIAFQAWRDYMEIKLKVLWEEIKSVFNTLDILGALERFGQLILALFVAGNVLIMKWFYDLGASIGQWLIDEGAKLGNDAAKGLSTIWEAVKKIFDPESWKQLGIKAFNGLLNGIKQVVQTIKDFINKNLIDKLNGLRISIPSNNLTNAFGIAGGSIGFNIPRLATGGLVTRSTIANIGEAGREAVLPLDRNTGWMDVLAEKINGGGSNGNVGSVTIDMSKVSKPFYSRSEMIAFGDMCAEAMEARGMRVSRVY